jgi:hypothetical protein
MRHIPEEELHAYLDQALSRSQCVEIESHLAECLACRGRRDAIAALRDRTTALLAALAPGRAVTPPFELIEARRAAAAARRRERVRRAVWAASLLAAVGTGWGLSQVTNDRAAAAFSPAPAEVAAAPAATVGAASQAGEAAPTPSGRAGEAEAADRLSSPPSAIVVGEAPPAATPVASRAARFVVPSRLQDEPASGPRFGERLAAPQSLQVSSSGLLEGMALEGLWRTLSWENAQEEAGGSPAHVDGLPVVHVQLQHAASGKPLMVVAQQLGSGDVIRTIEGPAADVSSLLRGSRPGSSPWPTVEPGDDGAVTGSEGSIVTMQGDRILAISAPGMSSDSLAAIARRVNAARAGR